MTYVQDENGLVEHDKENPVCPLIAAAVKQLTDGFVERSTFGRDGASPRVLSKRLDSLPGEHKPAARGTGIVPTDIAGRSS